MNQKTAKLLRRFDPANYKASKRTWNETPQPDRAKIRKAIKERGK